MSKKEYAEKLKDLKFPDTSDMEISMYNPHFQRLDIDGLVTPCNCGNSYLKLVEKLWGERTIYVECNSCKGRGLGWDTIESAINSWDGKPIWEDKR
jgi:hypothetical protein